MNLLFIKKNLILSLMKFFIKKKKTDKASKI